MTISNKVINMCFPGNKLQFAIGSIILKIDKKSKSKIYSLFKGQTKGKLKNSTDCHLIASPKNYFWESVSSYSVPRSF